MFPDGPIATYAFHSTFVGYGTVDGTILTLNRDVNGP